MEKIKKEKRWIEIEDVPYISLDLYIIEGEISEVSKKIKSIRNKLKEAYVLREKSYEKSGAKNREKFTPFSDYQKITLELEIDYYDGDSDRYLVIKVWREETIEEAKKRITEEKKEKESQKIAQEKREKAILEALKKKYDRI